MKNRKFITRLAAFLLVGALAFSATSFTSEAAGATETAKERVTRLANENRRAMTAEEIAYIKTLFVPEQYAKMYPDLKEAGLTTADQLWAHFILSGIWERRSPCYGLNIDVFATDSRDLQPQFGSDIVSYYVYYAANKKACQLYRPAPTLSRAASVGNYVYCVYDYAKGQTGPVEGAWPVQTPNDHPGVKTYSEQAKE